MDNGYSLWTFLFLGYFVLLNGGYILLSVFSIHSLRRYIDRHSLDHLAQSYAGFHPPVSILAPAYNEAANIAASVRSLLQLDYPEFEIIVINDGSRDETLQVLQREFALLPFPEAYWRRLPCAEIRGIYCSARYPQLKVIDKENGGKSDALNAGINASRYPLFCAVDADSLLQRDALFRVVQPFLEDPLTLVAGGTVRIANGCRISGGYLDRVGLPASWLERFQIIEYLRAFLFGRLGWSPLNAVLIVSGAFGLFRKQAVIEAGGYRTQTIGEDMELIVRLHRRYRLQRRPYRIVYVPDPICWTEAPDNLRVLRSQRTRWQRGLAESLALHWPLAFNPRAGFLGCFAYPFFLLFELLGPLVEVLGYTLMIMGLLLGAISWSAFTTFVFVAVSLGIMLSVTALLLEEISFRFYSRPGQLLRLLVAAVLENFGYRQLTSWWRFQGLLKWLIGAQQHWGEMTRSAALAEKTPENQRRP